MISKTMDRLESFLKVQERPITTGAIEARTQISMSYAGTLLRKLIKDGKVVRQPIVDQGRRKYAYLHIDNVKPKVIYPPVKVEPEVVEKLEPLGFWGKVRKLFG